MRIYKFLVFIVFLSTQTIFTGCGGDSSRFTGVSVTPANTTVAPGSISQQQFTAMESSEAMSIDMSCLVSWSVSGDPIFSGTSFCGLATIAAPTTRGTAAITATDNANRISGEATFTVANPNALIVTSQPTVTILPNTLYMAVGTSHQFSSLGTFPSSTFTQDLTAIDQQTPHAGSTAWGKTAWTSNSTDGISPSVASGLVTIPTPTIGTLVITATYSYDNGASATGSRSLTIISSQLQSLAVTSPASNIAVSTDCQFTATGTAADATTRNYTTAVTWNSSNTSVATITSGGVATAVTAGSTIITATDPITGIVSPGVTLTVN